jgi:hypothetical protein
MKAHKIVILVIAVLLTAGVWYHEYLYDYPKPPMTVWDHLFEIVFVGTGYATVFYFVMSGIYTLVAKVVSKLKFHSK